MQIASKPIDATVSAVGGKQRNDRLDLTVTISNRGGQSTPVSVWLQPRSNDADSQELLAWWREDNTCTLSDLVEVGANQKKSVKLDLRVPSRAKSIVYHYDIWISAREYPDLQPLRLAQQLRVFPPTDKNSKPEFAIVEPAMAREEPYPLSPGESVEVKLRVENRSGIVDRFHLECDLPRTWYDVRYPDGTDELQLNPNTNHIGEILLVLHPPQSSRAGVYSPTLRLNSNWHFANRGTQIDILYFRLLPVRDLQLELKPTEIYLPQPRHATSDAETPRQPGIFRVELANRGNTSRLVDLQAFPLPRVPLKCEFLPEMQSQATIDLDLDETCKIPIEVRVQRWKAPLRRKDRTLPFEVTLTDLDVDAEKRESQTLRGTVVWQRTPGWVWWVLLLLALGAAGWLAWWLWKLLYVLPPAPKIDRFSARRADNGDPLKSVVLLNFTVSNFTVKDDEKDVENLDSLMLTYLDASGQRTSNRFDRQTLALQPQDAVSENPQTFVNPSANPQNQPDKSQKNHFQLQQCQSIETEKNVQSLQCQFKAENLPPANDYSFELQIFPTPARTKFGIRQRDASQPTDVETTESVTIRPIPALQLQNLRSNILPAANAREIVSIDWEIHNIQTLEKLNIIQTEAQGKSEIYTYSYQNSRFISPENEPISLDCKLAQEQTLACNWKLNQQLYPSQYKYKVEVFSQQNPQEPTSALETQNTIVFTPPQLERFSPVPRPYIGGEDNILFDFAIDNPRQVKALILRAIDPSTARSQELQRYDFNSNGDNFLPADLQTCQLETRERTSKLICQNIPTQPLPIGEYQFELVAISQQEGGQPMSLSSDAIVVRPPSVGGETAAGGTGGTGGDRALAGIDFKINGQPVGEDPTTFIFALNPNGAPTLINLAWEIKDAQNRNLQVSLSPLLATADAKGSLKFALQGAPAQQTFTLQVTNELGEVATRTALVQTYPSASTSAPVPPPADRSRPPVSPKLPPPPTNPDNLRPLEVPPTLD